jgi:bifunctional UDP-N-acetylglucosamine pyrophosphorylase/glucosamine-1-phosphate N-acetyltransferase
MNIQPIILAAGKGKRMGNPDLPKVLTPLRGKPIVAHLLEVLAKGSFMPAALVVGHRHELVEEALGDSYRYIMQPELLGTGDAIKCCQAALQGTADAYLVMNGDHPLFSLATIEQLVAQHERDGAVMSLATVKTDQEAFANFGRIIRNSDGEIEAIREQKDSSEAELSLHEYNPALYCLSDAWLWPALAQITPENAQHEFYLTDLLQIAVEQGRKVGSITIERWQEALGINTPEQLAEVEKWMS